MSIPRQIHWQAAQHLLEFLHFTQDTQLTFTCKSDKDMILESYSDASHAQDLEERRSTSGFVIKLGNAEVISGSHRQAFCTDSTAYAELVALHDLRYEVKWARNMLKWLGYEQQEPSILQCDNMATVHFSQTGSGRSKMKHVDIKHMAIRDDVQNNSLRVQYVSTKDMTADIFTKPLSWPIAKRHMQALGLRKGEY